MNRIIGAPVPVLAIADPVAGQSIITYGVFTNHGETTAGRAPRYKTRNTDEGRKTRIPVGFVVELLDRGVLATFVATDGAVDVGPQVSPRASGSFSPFVDAMTVNLQPERATGSDRIRLYAEPGPWRMKRALAPLE